MTKARDEEGGRQEQEFRAGGRIVQGDLLLDEIKVGHLAQQPTTQRPGAVIFASDGQNGFAHLHTPRSHQAHYPRPDSLPQSRKLTLSPALFYFPPKMFTFFSQRNEKCVRLLTVGSEVSRMPAAPRGLRMLYLAYQTQSDIMAAVRTWASFATPATRPPPLAAEPTLRNLAAAYELIARAGLTHNPPAFGLSFVTVGKRDLGGREEAAAPPPVASLLHFTQ